MSEPLVSVVIPVYNGGHYLDECIASVLAQTYHNWNLVIADNLSTDRTAEIAAEYASSDARISHRRCSTHVGADENHNRAFRMIDEKSVYCKVLQADDWLYPQCLEAMVRVAQEGDNIGVVGGYRLWGDIVDLVGFPYTRTTIPGHVVLRQCLTGGPYVTGAPSALLLRSDLVRARDPFYDPAFWHADTDAVYWALTQSDFGYVHQVLTFARRQEGARMEWADRVNSYIPANIRFVLKYGNVVLGEEEYRRQLRSDLYQYVRFHVRQTPKISRLRDAEFSRFHLEETRRISAEANGDRDVAAAMAIVRALLLRRRIFGLRPATKADHRS